MSTLQHSKCSRSYSQLALSPRNETILYREKSPQHISQAYFFDKASPKSSSSAVTHSSNKQTEAAQDITETFRVYVRIRPLNKKEIESAEARKQTHIISRKENTVYISGANSKYQEFRIREDKVYAFDDVFDEDNSTSDIYSQVFTSTIENIVNGYNSTVLAYGMTGSGKTHTMFGDIAKYTGEALKSPGLITLSVQDLFKALEQEKEADVQLQMKFSYLEIYNEQVRDLLSEQQTNENLMVVEDPNKGVIIPGLSSFDVKECQDVMDLIMFGNARRVMAPTNANQFSSRSHAVLQISIEKLQNLENNLQISTQSKLCLVDLAGSERAAASDNRGIRQMEGANINRSLLALGNCINVLSDPNTKRTFVPYRDSKLTRLLKDSLGGNTKTILIACVSPSYMAYEETISTLKYAYSARKIKGKVVRNVKEVETDVTQYQNIIDNLKAEIGTLRNQLSASTPQVDIGAYLEYRSHADHMEKALDAVSNNLIVNLEERYELNQASKELEDMKSQNAAALKVKMAELDKAQDDTIKFNRISQEIVFLRNIKERNNAVQIEVQENLKKNLLEKKDFREKILQIPHSNYQSNPRTGYSSRKSVDRGFEIKDLEVRINKSEKEEEYEKDEKINELKKYIEKLQREMDEKDKLLEQDQEVISALTEKNKKLEGEKQRREHIKKAQLPRLVHVENDLFSKVISDKVRTPIEIEEKQQNFVSIDNLQSQLSSMQFALENSSGDIRDPSLYQIKEVDTLLESSKPSRLSLSSGIITQNMLLLSDAVGELKLKEEQIVKQKNKEMLGNKHENIIKIVNNFVQKDKIQDDLIGFNSKRTTKDEVQSKDIKKEYSTKQETVAKNKNKKEIEIEVGPEKVPPLTGFNIDILSEISGISPRGNEPSLEFSPREFSLEHITQQEQQEQQLPSRTHTKPQISSKATIRNSEKKLYGPDSRVSTLNDDNENSEYRGMNPNVMNPGSIYSRSRIEDQTPKNQNTGNTNRSKYLHKAQSIYTPVYYHGLLGDQDEVSNLSLDQLTNAEDLKTPITLLSPEKEQGSFHIYSKQSLPNYRVEGYSDVPPLRFVSSKKDSFNYGSITDFERIHKKSFVIAPDPALQKSQISQDISRTANSSIIPSDVRANSRNRQYRDSSSERGKSPSTLRNLSATRDFLKNFRAKLNGLAAAEENNKIEKSTIRDMTDLLLEYQNNKDLFSAKDYFFLQNLGAKIVQKAHEKETMEKKMRSTGGKTSRSGSANLRTQESLNKSIKIAKTEHTKKTVTTEKKDIRTTGRFGESPNKTALTVVKSPSRYIKEKKEDVGIRKQGSTKAMGVKAKLDNSELNNSNIRENKNKETSQSRTNLGQRKKSPVVESIVKRAWESTAGTGEGQEGRNRPGRVGSQLKIRMPGLEDKVEPVRSPKVSRVMSPAFNEMSRKYRSDGKAL